MVFLYLDQKTLAPCFSPLSPARPFVERYQPCPFIQSYNISIYILENLKVGDADANVKSQIEYVQL